VFSRLSHKLLPLLQLTRMALVFTAIADATCAFLLLHRGADEVPWHELAPVVAISVGLYGFGMSLNDIIDRRRDVTVAPHRPLPSNRLGVTTAHLVCGGLFTLAIASAATYAHLTGNWFSLGLAIWTGLLIYFYDVAGKYLVAPGLLSLGLIRFFHCLIPAPQLPVLWHPLLLLNHVAVLSAIAYYLEEKRPVLTRSHWWTALGGLALVNVAVIALVATRRADRFGSWLDDLNITPWLLLPLGAVIAFALLAAWTIRRSASGRSAGQAIMLYGLLWLIVYDAAFTGAYVSWRAALAVALLLPIAYFSVQLMRWWSAVVAISQRPAYQRAAS
jgi:4-hydroxybenzoate polyprenyltransferase